MKIKIKKIYIAGFASFISLVLAFLFLQELFALLNYQNISVLIMPAVFFSSLIYSINYWLSLRDKEKIIEEVSKEEAHGDPIKESEIKKHLVQMVSNESYTLNIFKNKQN